VASLTNQADPIGASEGKFSGADNVQQGVIHAQTAKSSIGSWRLARAGVKIFNSSFVVYGLFSVRGKPCSTDNFC
jgi:hypothetical protein